MSATDTNKTHINCKVSIKLQTNSQDYEDESYVCPECATKLTDTMRFKEQVLETLNILQGNGCKSIQESFL